MNDEDAKNKRRETYGLWAMNKTDDEIKQKLNNFGFAIDEVETFVKDTFGAKYDYRINECEFSFDYARLHCDVYGAKYVDDIQRDGDTTRITGYLEYDEEKLACDVEDLVEEMMNSESYESTIEDHGEGSIFVIISGIQDVDQAEEEWEVFDEIIKSHTK